MLAGVSINSAAPGRKHKKSDRSACRVRPALEHAIADLLCNRLNTHSQRYLVSPASVTGGAISARSEAAMERIITGAE